MAAPVTGEVIDTAAATALAQEVRAENLPHLATIEIVDAASYQAAAAKLRDFAARRKYTEQKFAKIKKDAHGAWKGICALENELLQPIEVADRKQRDALLAYEREQDRRRREEQQRLEEEARKAEQARLLDEAAHLESQGHRELAVAAVEAALAAPAPVVTIAPTTPHVAGVSTGEHWTFRPVNDDEARAVELLAKTGNHAYLMLDRKKLAAYARSHKAGARLPGIQFFDEGKVIVRS
jgi:hypothetical protein